jgi:hypothetical protein
MFFFNLLLYLIVTFHLENELNELFPETPKLLNFTPTVECPNLTARTSSVLALW